MSLDRFKSKLEQREAIVKFTKRMITKGSESHVSKTMESQLIRLEEEIKQLKIKIKRSK